MNAKRVSNLQLTGKTAHSDRCITLILNALVMVILEVWKMDKLTCIVCPRGCEMTIKNVDGKWVVGGNECKRGVDYAVQEAECPVRILTTSVWVEGGDYALASVKTKQPIPCSSITKALTQLNDITLTAPVEVGQVIIPDIAGTGIDLVATRHVLAV